MSRRVAVVGLVAAAGLAAVGAGGCKRLQEKQALRKYAAKEPRLVEARAAVVGLDPTLQQKVKTADTAGLRRFLKDRYLPRLRRWVGVLRGLPARTARLKRIRDRYLAVLERTLEAHEGFADGLGSTSRVEAWAVLQQARRRRVEARERYRRDLDAYYREHDLRRSKR